MKKVRIGIVGTGFASDWHYKGFLQNRNAEIKGMCHTYNLDDPKYLDKQEALIQKCASLGIKPYASFDTMVKDSTIDALIICSINPLHFEQIIKAIENRKHILVEKPVVTNAEQLLRIRKLSLEKKVKIFPAHNFVYLKAIQKAKAIIEHGEIGQIIHSSLVSSHTISEAHSTGWRANKELSMGGAMLDSGHHLIYQSLYLLGKPIKIQSYKSKMVLKNMDCEDTMQLSLQYDDGSIAVIMQSWTSDHSKMINGIRILGTKGSLVITDALHFNNKKVVRKIDYLESFVNQSKAFTNYILKNTPPISNLETVLDILELTSRAYEIAERESIRII
jgi:predicted dehydrogenase